MSDSMKDRVALVTGAASGIGWAIASAYAAAGARVVLADLDAPALAARAESLGEAALAVPADVRVEAQVKAMVSAAVERFGALHVAVNAAGVGSYAPITELSEAQWDFVLDICLKGVFLSMKHEARQMKRQGAGVIVNIASLNAFQPGEGISAYCSAKAGVEMLTRVAAMELGPHGVRVCGIAPGFVETAMTERMLQIPAVRAAVLENLPLARIGTPGDVADAALFLGSSAASWISGTTLCVDGASSTKRYPELIRLYSASAARRTQGDDTPR